MLRIKAYLNLILLALSINCFGQISINFPLNNAVYQRGNNNLGNLTISGRYQNFTTNKIEARLKNPSTGLVVSGFDWTTIVSNPVLGHYYGTLSNVPGGWYILEVRNLSGTTVLNSTTINRVGIGEVFVIAGQSNAEGFIGYGSPDAQKEQVVSHNYNDYQYNINNTDKIPSFPVFSTILANNFISNKGSSSWAYGKLGDLLTNRLGVPIAFFNAGASGTSSKNWSESALGLPTNNEYTGIQYASLVGAPYIHFRNALKYYANNFGIRGVLWHQGETDKDKGVSTADYLSRLSTVISKSREHFNQNLNWVISRASYGSGITSSQVIGGQNQTVQQNTTKNFYGPETDLIQPRKLIDSNGDDVHFEGAKLIDLANEWDFALNSAYFSNSTPISPSILKPIAISCGINSYTLTAPNGFSEYKWVKVDINGNYNFEQISEATSQSISRTEGTYICYLTDNNGQISFSQIVDIEYIKQFCGINYPICTNSVYVSDLPFISQTNGWGPIERDKSNGEQNANDGLVLTLNGITYAKGLGVHANSEAQISLSNSNYSTFSAKIGVDDEVTDSQPSSLIFKVYGDNTLLYSSPVMTSTSTTLNINIPITGYSILKLVVDGIDDIAFDHADWADAKLETSSTIGNAPIVSTNKNLVNIGQSVIITSTACPSGSSIIWSDNSSINPRTAIIGATTSFSSTCISNSSNCRITFYSTPVVINVLPNCANNYTLTSPANDISSNDLTYKVSSTINASNKITNAKKVTYDAKESILLTPGFFADNGTVFTAKTGGCVN